MGIVYTKLCFKDEIRLLRLEPGTFSSPVKISLIHARLGESPTYDALSYMWGEDQGGQGQVLDVEDGRMFEVRQNLGNALRCLRLHDEVRVLWVDAVCINQADDSERAHQVAHMGMIYSQATTVRVWLGLPEPSTSEAFRFLGDLPAVTMLKGGFTEASEWESVADLCEREYWSRLWIIQEVVLAARIEIHCGDRVLSWEDFSDLLFTFEKLFQTYDSQTQRRLFTILTSEASTRIFTSAAMKICRQRRANTDSGPARNLASLMCLIWNHRKARCVDVRDKIFGMHSFAPLCCREANPVDYACSAFTLCRRLLDHEIACHASETGGSEGTVGRSVDLHYLILEGALRQIDSNNAFEIGGLDVGDEQLVNKDQKARPQSVNNTEIIGRNCGEVVFVTAPLSSLFIDSESVNVPRTMVESFSLTKFGSENIENSALTIQIITALRLVSSSRPRIESYRESRRVVRDMKMVDLNDPNLSGDSVAQSFQAVLRFAAELLRTEDFLRINSGHEDCVMILIEKGRQREIGFGPTGTKIGDILCTFRDTDVMTIVREVVGSHKLVGEASFLKRPESLDAAPSEGSRITIEVDTFEIQAFSRMQLHCKLPELTDYRIVLTMPPSIQQPRDVQQPPAYIRRPTRQEPPKYSRYLPSEYHVIQQARRIKPSTGKYACPRCDATFENSRDNLRHVASWSHLQCRKCQSWTSWESPVSETYTTDLCTQCRNEGRSCDGSDLKPNIGGNENDSHPWYPNDMASSTDDSVRDSLIESEISSSNATTVSNRYSRTSGEPEMDIWDSRLQYIHNRQEIWDQTCRLFRGRREFERSEEPDRNN
jgi:hypothetical protein